ncbi:Protein CBR-GLR-7 [Aphelenchoides fujianensis]|nr:Protein CBR-GLR-7 [Aphelenchoides fujianensis]
MPSYVYHITSELDNSIRFVEGATIEESALADADFVISLLDNGALIEQLAARVQTAELPTIQTRLHQWEGVSRVDENDTTSNQNYAVMIPSFVVFDNMLDDLLQALEITTNITVIYDEQYQNSMEYDWQRPFLTANISASFEVAEKTPELITEHLNRLERASKILLFITDTSSVEAYVLAGQSQIEANQWRWIVFTRDALAFKCQECENVQIHWARVVKSTASEELANFADFVWSEELETSFLYSRHTKHQLQMSYCLDLVYTALAMLQGFNETTEDVIRNESALDWRQQNASLHSTLRRSRDFDFGPYKHHANGVFYQARLQQINAVDIRIDRMSRFPHSKFSKLCPKVANWTFSDGLQPLYPGGIGVNVRQLTHYRVVTVLQEPFVEFGGPEKTFGFQGYCIDLLEFIREDLNFTYEIYLVPDGKFGAMEQTGNWNGMIGQLVSGEADIALGPISQIAEREVDVDFTMPFYDLVGTAIVMRRTEVETSLFKFLAVLEWPVWVCIAGAYLFTSLLLWTFDRFSPYSYRNNREKYKEDAEKREFTLRECFWFCMTSLTPQGGRRGEAPKNLSGRLVAATWWLFGFIIIASCKLHSFFCAHSIDSLDTANLAAFLTVSRMEQQINGLDDLSKQYKIRYAPLKDGATETYFKRMAEIEEQFYNIWKQMSLNETMTSAERAKLAVWDYPVSDKYTNMWRFMQESVLPANASEAIERVMRRTENGRDNSNKWVACTRRLGDAMMIKYATLTNCKLQQIGQEFSRKPYGLAVQKGSRLKSEISTSISGLLNARKLENLKEKWWHQNPKVEHEEESTGISIENIGGVFILILGGIVISLTMLVVEFFYYKRKEGRGLGDGGHKEDVRMNAFSVVAAHRVRPADSPGLRSLPSSDASATTASLDGPLGGGLTFEGAEGGSHLSHRAHSSTAAHRF